MPSTFTWLDYSEKQRQRALDVVDLFGEPSTVDELGIGMVRDAFSDLFFPGTSTIQTRARYFLFIPWIYLDLERLRVSGSDVEDRARREELRFVEPLSRAADAEGTFGMEARESLKRLPSSVYWNGLGTWGIRLFPGSRSQYHRSLDGYYAWLRGKTQQDLEEEDYRIRPNWRPGIPAPPDDFPDGATFEFRREESEYLRDRILAKAPGTLLAHLMDGGETFPEVDFPWRHPGYEPSRRASASSWRTPRTSRWRCTGRLSSTT